MRKYETYYVWGYLKGYIVVTLHVNLWTTDWDFFEQIFEKAHHIEH